jgi:acyl-CoA reductase-like NAD-dependent aldehyde dehydrogenase
MLSYKPAAWIQDRFVTIGGEPALKIESPWTGELIAEIPNAGADLVDEAAGSAEQAFKHNRSVSSTDRCEWLTRAAAEIERRAEEFIEASVRYIGKPRRAAAFETQRTVAFMRSVVQQLAGFGGEVVPLDSTKAGAGLLGFARRVPYGVVAAVTPFNAPANLLMQKLAPALATGNAVVVKPSPEGTLTALLIAQCLSEAGLPAGLCNVVPGGAVEAQALAAHRSVAVVTITGGTAAGEALARAAGAKKFIGELGGNSPNIVLADADVADAAKRICVSGFEAAGQQCISAQRIIVEAAVYEAFLEKFVEESRRLKVGDPASAETDVGPVVNTRSADRIVKMIEDTVAVGAKLQTLPQRKGCLLFPTILTEAPIESRAVQEEIFGPVVVVMKAKDEKGALAIANDCQFGLQGSVFTRSLASAIRVTEQLNVGSVWVNEGSRFRLDNYPFGGVGRSGHGREGTRYALEEYTQWKFTGIRLPPEAV